MSRCRPFATVVPGRLTALFMLLILTAAVPLRADTFYQGFFTLSRESQGVFSLLGDVPALAAGRGGLELPSGCSLLDAKRYPRPERLMLSFRFSCANGWTAGSSLRLPFVLDGVIFDSRLADQPVRQVLSAQPRGLVLTPDAASRGGRPLWQVAADYLDQGVRHIWLGWDHLVFVFCLCLLARSLPILLATVTAFTIGHSVSMALAFLDVIRVAIAPVEAVIALSILFVAREAWVSVDPVRSGAGRDEWAPYNRDRGDPVAGRGGALALVIAGFGLIHGLGFASALDALGVAPSETIPALLFFNLGVEVGQLMFIFALLALKQGLGERPMLRFANRLALLLVGSVGSFWMFERVAGFLPAPA